MLKEIEKAVEVFHTIFFCTKENKSKFISESKLAAFITLLTELLIVRFQKAWYPENPTKGSGFRCIRVNSQSMDPIIKECLRKTKIKVPSDLAFMELTIWVDPKQVSVRIGEDGSICDYAIDEDKKEESDEGFSSRSSSPEFVSSGSTSPSSRQSPVSSESSPTPLSKLNYNPYSPPLQVSYPTIYRPSQSPLPATMSPHHYQLTGSQGMPAASVAPGHQGDYPISSHSHIPVSPQRVASYTRPRALFPSSDNGSSSVIDTLGKLPCNPFTMSMNYNMNMLQGAYREMIAVK